MSTLNSDILPRLAAKTADTALSAMPVVVVMGARQTGKSTLVRTHPGLRDRPYLSLDDFDVRARARTAPDDLVMHAPRLVLDEVQREPGLLLAIKRAVDERRPRQPGQYVLTGSANLLLLERVSETLAGRAAYLPLWPLTRREQLGEGRAGIWSELLTTPVVEWHDLVRAQPDAPADWRKLALRGGYPTPAYEMTTAEARHVWFSGYVQTYLERDLQTLSAVENLVDFRRLMRAACLRLGTTVNQAEMGRDTGIARPTVHRYLNLLEATYQLVRVEPYSVNRTKRLVKTPKLYWSDAGLALHLAGETRPRGEHLENIVLHDLLAWRDAQLSPPQVLFWRTAEGEEVDFVIEQGDRLLPIEVKAAARPLSQHVRHLRTFQEQYGEAAPGALLLHNGSEVFWMARGILAAPWWRIL